MRVGCVFVRDGEGRGGAGQRANAQRSVARRVGEAEGEGGWAVGEVVVDFRAHGGSVVHLLTRHSP